MCVPHLASRVHAYEIVVPTDSILDEQTGGSSASACLARIFNSYVGPLHSKPSVLYKMIYSSTASVHHPYPLPSARESTLSESSNREKKFSAVRRLLALGSASQSVLAVGDLPGRCPLPSSSALLVYLTHSRAANQPINGGCADDG